jgi:hypothetical protein
VTEAPHRAGRSLPPARLRGRALLQRWVPVVALAEVVGFVAPALAGALTADAAVAVVVPALLVAGALEGAVLGAGQALVLRATLPAFPTSRWIAVTAGAAVFAYVLGLLPSLSVSWWTDWPVAVSGLLGVVVGVGLLLTIGTAQWAVLRGRVPRAARWIGATALGWLIGLGFFFAVATPLWHPGQPVGVTVGIGLLAGALMALAMAIVTGLALVGLVGTGTADG